MNENTWLTLYLASFWKDWQIYRHSTLFLKKWREEARQNEKKFNECLAAINNSFEGSLTKSTTLWKNYLNGRRNQSSSFNFDMFILRWESWNGHMDYSNINWGFILTFYFFLYLIKFLIFTFFFQLYIINVRDEE